MITVVDVHLAKKTELEFCLSGCRYTRALSAYQILGKPDITLRIDVDADPDSMQGGTEKMNAMPAGGRLVYHTFLDIVHTVVRRWIWSGVADAFAAIAIASKALVCDALALRAPVGTGMAEATVEHIPAMQASAPGQGCVPGVWVKSSCCSITVNERKELLSELRFLGGHWRWWPVRCCSYAASRNICRYLCGGGWRFLFRKDHHWPGCIRLLRDMELIIEPG